MKKILLATSLLLMTIISLGQKRAPADSFKISGTIYGDKLRSGPVLPGAIVLINNDKKVTTNGKGKYSAFVKKGDVLTAKYLGYQPQKIRVKKRLDTLNIRLFEDVKGFQ